MSSEDYSYLLFFLVLVQFYFLRKSYVKNRVLRLEFSMFVRQTSIQIDELSSIAGEAIIEEVKRQNPDIPEKDAQDHIPDAVSDATKTYWEEVNHVNKNLQRNGIKQISLMDFGFLLSNSYK